MQSTDDTAFTAIMEKTWRFYHVKPNGDELADWFELLKAFPLEAIATAFSRHLIDPRAGAYLPKPADIIRHLPIPKPEDDGRPSADEAWGMLLRLIRDEAETGVLSEEIREGWAACGPILSAGDEIGARRCFIAVYDTHVRDARARQEPPHWTATLGTDPRLRDIRLQEAVAAKRLSRDHATGLLSGPTPVSLEQVAGLLEGPDAPPEERPTAHRLRDLAAIIRAGSRESERRRQDERDSKIARETEARECAADALKRRWITLDTGGKENAA